MDTNVVSQVGSCAVFGFTRSTEKLEEWSNRLGITPKTIDFGDWGHFLFHTTYGDVVETEEAIGLKLGFVRSPAGASISAQQLLDEGIASPGRINNEMLRGNGLVACFGKRQANFSAYQTLLAAYQLHYAVVGEDILCSDSLRCLVSMLGDVELEEKLVPWHFALLYVPGRLTLLRGVKRLFPGELLSWKEGGLNIRLAQDLRFSNNGYRFERANEHTTALVHQRLGDVLDAYTMDAKNSGHDSLGSLLSGGIDSSLLQLIMNERSSEKTRSFTYAPTQAPNFEFEIEYARQASELLGTQHSFVEIAPEDFPGLLVRATEILGQPVITDPELNKLGLAEYLGKHVDDLHYFVNGLAAGTLFGGAQALKLKFLEIADQVPLAEYALRVTGKLLRPFTSHSQVLLKAADMMACLYNPNSFVTPLNTKGTHLQFELPRRFFGDEAILEAFQYRRKLEAEYLGSDYPIEMVYVIALLTHVYEVQVQSQRLFLSMGKEQIYPFMDEDVIRLAFAFRPQMRYVSHFTYKYPFRKILAQNSLSTIVNRKRKGGSLVFTDLLNWMRSGPLHEMVRDIEVPGFMSRKEFENLIQHPNWFLWSLLTFDIFQKRILNSLGN